MSFSKRTTREAPMCLTYDNEQARAAIAALNAASVPGSATEGYAHARALLASLAELPDDIRAKLAATYERVAGEALDTHAIVRRALDAAADADPALVGIASMKVEEVLPPTKAGASWIVTISRPAPDGGRNYVDVLVADGANPGAEKVMPSFKHGFKGAASTP